MISVVIVTFNEADKLIRCLKSIKDFVQEIVVVDIGSTDSTEEVLKKFNARVFKHRWVPYADPIRNFALSKASGDWVLMLDPDEVVPVKLKRYLKDFTKIAKDQDLVAINIPFKNVFFGQWIAHTNFWPDKHIRFFKKGRVVWQSQVHSYPQVSGQIWEAPNDSDLAIVHLGYETYQQFIIKQRKYALAAAQNIVSSGGGFSFLNLIWMPTREFLARFIKHQGYKDGKHGVFLVGVLMWYHLLIQLNIIKLKTGRIK